MKVRWKKNKGIKPENLLVRLNQEKTITDDGRPSYDSFVYYDVFSALFSMLDFPKSVISDIPEDYLISKAIDEAAIDGEITKESFLNKINEVVSSEFSTREKRYHLLTSISVTGDIPFSSIEYEGAKIRLLSSYPKKYSCRSKVVKDNNSKFESEHRGYRKVIVTVKSKSYRGAASKALAALDLVRAILCLQSNAQKEIIGDPDMPINRIRLGQVHTLHKENGSSATEGMVWYEPYFRYQSPYVIRENGFYRKNFMFYFDALNTQPYAREVRDSLVRFVRSLDNPNHNSAFVQLWGALEGLVASDSKNCDPISRRCSFLFDDSAYHEQMIEHLREYRNSNVHAGYQSERAKIYCFQAQFYFRQMVIVLLRNAFGFKSIKEALLFFDMPTSLEELEDKEKNIANALYFKRYRDSKYPQ